MKNAREYTRSAGHDDNRNSWTTKKKKKKQRQVANLGLTQHPRSHRGGGGARAGG